jgi:hypothetical protein
MSIKEYVPDEIEAGVYSLPSIFYTLCTWWNTWEHNIKLKAMHWSDLCCKDQIFDFHVSLTQNTLFGIFFGKDIMFECGENLFFIEIKAISTTAWSKTT